MKISPGPDNMMLYTWELGVAGSKIDNSGNSKELETRKKQEIKGTRERQRQRKTDK